MRQWALEQGMTVSTRRVLSPNVLAAYDAARGQ
ncbi:hypothetical protein [Microbacterium binotii]